MEISISLAEIIEKMELTNLTPEVNLDDKLVKVADVNRPALQLAGYFDHFSAERIQIIGNVEHTYVQTVEVEKRYKIFEQLLSREIPCMIFCRELYPEEHFLELAVEHGIPILQTKQETCMFMSDLIWFMKNELAQCISIHGVLVDVYGVGVLIMGESGIGKSESALELIKRGHRLVADDVVELHRVSEEKLIGSAPEITRHFIELRGIGIIDVKTLFGVQSVEKAKEIDLVIKLEEWDRDRTYDRLGLNQEYTELLGNKIVCHTVPLRPGRNLAIILEAVAINHRQKQMGYNAAKELYNKVQKNLLGK